MKDSMKDIVSVYATFGSEEEARRIGRQMVEERLAACTNILGPCRSIYRWQDEIEEADEVAVIFKASAAGASGLVDRIKELHSYEVPALVVWPTGGGNEEYQAWVLAQTASGEENGK